MSQLAENRHELGFTPELDPRGAPDRNPLSDLEQLPLHPGVRATPEVAGDLLRQVDAWAGQLADPATRDAARVRHLARLVAATRAKLALHEMLRNAAVAKGDVAAALLFDRVVQTDSRRLVAFVRELRAEDHGGTPVVRVTAVAVGDRPEVTVVAGRAR